MVVDVVGFEQLPQSGQASGWTIWRRAGQALWNWCAYHRERQVRGTARCAIEATHAARHAQRGLKQGASDA